jgi:hypothetical protein
MIAKLRTLSRLASATSPKAPRAPSGCDRRARWHEAVCRRRFRPRTYFRYFVAMRSGNRAIARLKRSAEQQTENSVDGSEFEAYDRRGRASVPCRIKLGVPIGGFGEHLTEMHAWLDQNCGADNWVITPAGLRGVVNDAVAIYFLDATRAGAFVRRWCSGSNVEISEGAFRVREISRRGGMWRGRTGHLERGRVSQQTLALPSL